MRIICVQCVHTLWANVYACFVGVGVRWQAVAKQAPQRFKWICKTRSADNEAFPAI